MILIVTNTRDVTSDLVIGELRRRGMAFLRLNCEALHAALPTFSLAGARPTFTISHDGAVIDVDDVRAAYLRRPNICGTVGRVGGSPAYARGEWGAMLQALYSVLRGRWLNDPWSMEAAEDKIGQLRRAHELGFLVPPTLASNDPVAISAFTSSYPAVVKPLRSGRVGGNAVVFTTRIGAVGHEDADAVRAVPFIAQEEILKAADVRVTVIGDEVFATAILSQEVDEAQTDWRRGDIQTLPHRVEALPPEVAAACRALVASFGLTFGAIDLVRDVDGAYWFLEVNANGQWGWIQAKTGQPIVEAIVDALARIGSA